MSERFVSRRSVLRGAGATAVLAAAGGTPLLTACGGSQAKQNTAEANQKVKLPAYIAPTVKPDLAGQSGGIMPGFLAYPADHKKTYDGIPGKGGTVQGMANIYYPLPPRPPQNKYWAELNKRLGVDLKINMIPAGDYATKFPTVIAGNDLPDLMQGQVVPNFPELLSAKFMELTEFLSGDNVKKYPNLAALPARSWKTTIYNGGIYGVPIPRDAVGGLPFIRKDLFDAAGVSNKPKNFEEFHEGCKALTDPSKKHWAMGSRGDVMAAVQAMLAAPNGWRYEKGKLTHLYETEEYRRALSVSAQFWKEGLIHPDAFGNNVNLKIWVNSGYIAYHNDGYQGWTQYIQDNVDNKGFELGILYYPGYDGGAGRIPLGGSSYSTTLFRKASKKRIEELLRICDWLASPFGSEEYLFRLYGIEGNDYTMDKDGNPVLSKVGLSETVIPIRYFAENPSVLYQPGRPQDAKAQWDYQKAYVPNGVPNPVLGFYSNTDVTKGPTYTSKFGDMADGVAQGRKTLKDWDALVKTWRKDIGDQIAKEYLQQIDKYGPNKD